MSAFLLFMATCGAISAVGAALLHRGSNHRISYVISIAAGGALGIALVVWLQTASPLWPPARVVASVAWVGLCNHAIGVAASIGGFRSFARSPRHVVDETVPEVLCDGIDVARAHGFSPVPAGATRLPTVGAVGVAMLDVEGTLAELQTVDPARILTFTSRTTSGADVVTSSAPIFPRSWPPGILLHRVVRRRSLPDVLAAHRQLVEDAVAAGHQFVPIEADDAVAAVSESERGQVGHILERPWRRAAEVYFATAGWTGLRGWDTRTPPWHRDGPPPTGD